MSEVPVDMLRAAFAQSVITTLAIQAMAYLRLISHPDVQFQDLLDALDRGPVIADDAARKLHQRIGLPATTPVTRRAFWEQVLQEHCISPAEHFQLPITTAASRPNRVLS